MFFYGGNKITIDKLCFYGIIMLIIFLIKGIKMQKRNTFQKKIITESLKRLPHPAADEIYNHIKEEYPNISKATVYRNLGILEKENIIKKVPVGTSPDRYDINCSEHCHFKCSICGGIYDIFDTDFLKDIDAHASAASGFFVSGHDIMFYGICPECDKKGCF